ncbi:MAG TPA: phosphocholine cytidylyltransferase family protein [Geminicoccaceae bacterium]|nr:phosphocholine cytidylyltransferase family protein [Geminicoccaceae bacterium]
MRAVILAAGVGRRLRPPDLRPKALLRFDGETLLARHLRVLRRCDVGRVDLCVGYRADEIAAEVARLGAAGRVTLHHNPDFERGSLLSLWTLRGALTAGEPVIFMDADVLYDHRIMERLVASKRPSCFLMDRELDEGEDPVKLCLRGGLLVDLHKRPTLPHDDRGEWIGFARFAPDVAARIAAAAEARVAAGGRDAIYEEAFRDVLLGSPPDTFGVEDVTGLPWIEIDFPGDLERAEREVLPRLAPLPR